MMSLAKGERQPPVEAIQILFVSVTLFISGASHLPDKTEGAGAPRFGFSNVEINLQTPSATALDLARPYYSHDVHVAGPGRIWVKIHKAGSVVVARAISVHPLPVSSAIEAVPK